MLTDHTRKDLEKVSRDLCRKNHLSYVYFTQKMGKRMHFLAGSGKATFTETHHLDITEKISISWQGALTENDISALRFRLVPLGKQAEQELI